MPVEIVLDTNGLEVSRWLLFLARDQLPFAMSLALNTVGKTAQAEETAGIFERFTVRRPGRLRTSIRMKASSKRNLVTTLTVRDTFLVQHEEGEVRHPGDLAPSIVQPESPQAQRIGVLRGRNTPKAYLQRATKPRPFVARMRSGKVGVFVRQRAGNHPKVRGQSSRYPIDLVFALERKVKLPRLLKAGATVEAVAVRDWEGAFGDALERAIATTR